MMPDDESLAKARAFVAEALEKQDLDDKTLDEVAAKVAGAVSAWNRRQRRALTIEAPRHEIGDIVQIIFDPEQPKDLEFCDCMGVVDQVEKDGVLLSITFPGHPGMAAGSVLRRWFGLGQVRATGGRYLHQDISAATRQ